MIRSCNNIVIPLKVTSQAQMQFTQQILADKDTTIPAKTLGQIPVQSKLPEKRNPPLNLSTPSPMSQSLHKLLTAG